MSCSTSIMTGGGIPLDKLHPIANMENLQTLPMVLTALKLIPSAWWQVYRPYSVAQCEAMMFSTMEEVLKNSFTLYMSIIDCRRSWGVIEPSQPWWREQVPLSISWKLVSLLSIQEHVSTSHSWTCIPPSHARTFISAHSTCKPVMAVPVWWDSLWPYLPSAVTAVDTNSHVFLQLCARDPPSYLKEWYSMEFASILSPVL